MLRFFLFAVIVLCTAAGVAPALVQVDRAQAQRSQLSPALTPGPPALPAPAAIDGFSSVRGQRTEAATATPPPQPPIREIIASAFAPMGPGAVAWGERIAGCESSYNPNAVNAESNARGLFQFLPSTWAGTPFAALSPFDPVANARAAAWLLAAYGPTQWQCRA